MAPAERTRSTLKPAHWALLALVVWAIVWSVHLAALDLPASRNADAIQRRALVMDDGTVVPRHQRNRTAVALPERDALLAEGQLTLVFLASAEDREGFPRLECSLAALGAFAHAPSVAELLLVSPIAHHAAVRQALDEAALPFRSRTIDDGTLLSRTVAYYKRFTPRRERRENGGRGVNYRVQMLLKLAVAQEVGTAFYLTLDCDVLLTQPLHFSDLVTDGRALVQGERWPYARRHDEGWWRAADRVLRGGGCVLDAGDAARALGGATIGVTPALLARAIALRTLARVEEAHAGRWWGAGWDELLFRLLAQAPDEFNWSEYSLYWTAGCAWAAEDGSSALQRLHAPFAAGARRLYAEDGFAWGDWETWDAASAFAPDAPAYFAVLQSISGVDPSWVAEKAAPFLAAAMEVRRVSSGHT